MLNKPTIIMKQFKNLILAGALVLGLAGFAVSCDKYGDDIDSLQTQVNAIKADLQALQAKVDAGKYVTNVSKSGDGIVITWNDNSTSTIETIKGDKGDAGAAGTVVTIVDGYWAFDGVKSEYPAVGPKGEQGEPGKQGPAGANGHDAKSPSIDETTGNWVVYAWNGETQEYDATDTGISAKGAQAYVVDMDNYYELNVAADKAGTTYTTVKLPKNPTTITEIEVLGVIDPNTNDEYEFNKITDGVVNYNATILADLNDDQKAWNKEEGVKTLAKGQALSTLASKNNKLLIRLAPATVDASKLAFTLVNTQLDEAPLTLGTPAAYKGLLTRSAESNGLWMVPVSAKEGLTYKDLDTYKAEFAVDEDHSILFAFKEKDGFTSDWNLSFNYDDKTNLEAKVLKVNTTVVTGKTNNKKYTNTEVQTDANIAAKVDVGDVTITFDDPNALYDAHLHFDEATIERWGIKYTEGTSFTITAQPDNVTVANFQVQVHYVDMTGTVKSEWIILHVNKSYSNVTEYPNKNVVINADNSKNKFDASLDAMFTNLDSNLNKWKADVESPAAITYQWYNKDAYEWETATNMTATLDKTTVNEATKFTWKLNDNTSAMKLGVPYRVVIEFKDKDGEVLSKLIQPITFSIPALSEFLVKEQVVFGGTSNGKAYMNYEDYTTYGNKKAYAFTHAFNKFDNVFANGSTIKFDINSEQKINGKPITDYAALENVDKNTVAVYLTDDKAYHTPIQIVITEAKYLGIYEYSKDERAANAFTLDVMSPIEQGVVTAANATGVSVVATADGTALVKESDFKATTYANVAYKVFKDAEFDSDGVATKFSSEYISNVTFQTANKNVFTLVADDGTSTDDEIEGNPATKDSKGNVTEGYITVKPANAGYEATENVNVVVTDIWGYTKKAAVPVTVKPNTAE